MKKIFYGWYIVMASGVIAVWAGMVFFGFTAFLNPIVQDLKWSYLAVSAAASLRSMEMGFLAPLMGYLSDKIGPRVVAFISGVACGAGYLMLSSIETLAMFYVSFFVLSIGFSGMGHAVVLTALANWFKRNLGKATGLAIMGYGLSGVLLPSLVDLISKYHWRTAFVILGIASWIIVLPASLFLKHRPEQYGYRVDGDKEISPAEAGGADNPLAPEYVITLRAALHSRAFWCLSLATSIFFGAMNAVTLHSMPYFLDLEMTQSTAAMLVMFIPLSTIPGRVVFGWLGDMFPKRMVMFVAYAAVTLGMLIFYQGDALWHFVVFLALFGVGYGGSLTVRAGLIRDYFGRKNFGSIHGVSLSIMTVGAIIGPAFAGWIFDLNKSYDLAWQICFWGMVITLPLILAIPKDPDCLKNAAQGQAA